MIEGLITDLALILMLGAIATVVFKKLKQPVVLGYIVAGFLASPHFSLVPSVVNEDNIEFWAQIGIIVLLFSLGLEFSFKKLINAGGSAIVTALIVVAGMMGTGFVVGKSMGFTAVNSMFMGAMVSMSSTTIIIKALSDLGMRQRRFVPKVLAVLIVEDLFAVVLMVILSSIALNNTVEGGELVKSILKLSFFLIAWFIVGVSVLPSLFSRFRYVISDEMMLILAMGLCFMMAILAVKSGFSMALGAFVMGSILAGTSQAERIERITAPVKDLFGAVFFISVGMMVDPEVITTYAGTIALLAAVVVVGMIVFGTLGMLVTGQSLRVAMESGFSLTQIGEFSFIIATLGMSLGVLDGSIYPIIVTVSVVTTFFTPFFIKSAEPCYNWVTRHLPEKWTLALENYSKSASESDKSKSRSVWGNIIKRFALRIVLYSVVIVAIGVLSRTYLLPAVRHMLGDAQWVDIAWGLGTLAVLSPFLYAIIVPSIKREERKKLYRENGRITLVPQLVMFIVGSILAIAFMMILLVGVVTSLTAFLLATGAFLLMVLVLSPVLRKRLLMVEKRFVSNINERENRRTGRENMLVSDLHLAYMVVGYNCPFVGERLKNADIRRKYGVNVVNIQRNSVLHPVPGGNVRIFPGDVLGVIGTDEQIQKMLPLVEANEHVDNASPVQPEFTHFTLGDTSPLLGKTLATARLREDYGSLLVAVQRNDDEEFLSPTPELDFRAGDTLWIVGEEKQLRALQ